MLITSFGAPDELFSAVSLSCAVCHRGICEALLGYTLIIWGFANG